MGVGIDQTRHENVTGEFQVRGLRVTARQPGGGPHLDNRAAVDGDGAIRDGAAVEGFQAAGKRQQPGRGYDQIGPGIEAIGIRLLVPSGSYFTIPF